MKRLSLIALTLPMEIRSLKDEMEDEMFGEEMIKLLFQRFKINTTDHEINGDNATVNGVLSYPDMEYFFESFFSLMFDSIMMEDEDLTEEDHDEFIMNTFKELIDETPDLEENITMELVKEDREWKILDMPDFDF